MSEPNQNSSEGCLSRLIGATACGSTVPSHGASSAIAIIASRITPPAIAVGCLRKASLKPRQVGDATMSITDAWIEQHVANIHREVDEHVGARKDQHHALDDRVIAPQDRIDREPPDSG